MNFFKSVFQDDDPPPSPPQHDEEDEEQDPQSETPNPQSPTQQQQSNSPKSLNQSNPQPPTWGFVGGLIKTFATKSESVIETYRRDLQEFSTGLKKETLTLKEVASSSLEVGASKAQESLESVGQAFDNIGSVVWSSTAQIIAQGNELDLDQNNNNYNSGSNNSNDVGLNLGSNLSSNSGRYSRFDAQLRGIQCDVNSFVEEIEDAGDFEKWKLTFDLGNKSEEMGNLMKENGVMEGIYKRVVPNVVDHDVFWLRYFYRVHKLEQAESVRAKLVERANEDEDLSWDLDDDEDEQLHQSPIRQEEKQQQEEERNDGDNVEVKKKEVSNEEEVGDKGVLNSSNEVAAEEAKVGGNEEDEGLKKKNGGGNVDEKAPSEGSKDSDISVVSSQPLSYREEEEDLGWDEIEDLGSDDDVSGGDKKGKQIEGSGGSLSNREELRKRLSVAEDDEDLSWDIEDGDEPIKKN